MSKLYQKRVSVGAFLKKGIDFKEGDLVEIANEGKEVSGEFGMQDIFLIKLQDGKEGNVSFNQTTINGLIDGYGPDALGWVGKKVKTWKVKQNVAGKFVDVWYFSHPDAELTENGFVLPIKAEKDSINTKISEGEDEVRAEDIPF